MCSANILAAFLGSATDCYYYGLLLTTDYTAADYIAADYSGAAAATSLCC